MLLTAILKASEGSEVMVVGATFEQTRNHLFKTAREMLKKFGIPHKANRVGGYLKLDMGGITFVCYCQEQAGTHPIKNYDYTLTDHYALEYQFAKERRRE